MNTLYLITIVDYRVEEDNYAEGCTGNIISDGWYGTKRFVVSSKEELIKELCNHLYCNEDEAASLENIENNQYSFSWLVDKDELPASESQIEQWKRGEISLYCADAYITIDKINPLNSLEEMKEK